MKILKTIEAGFAPSTKSTLKLNGLQLAKQKKQEERKKVETKTKYKQGQIAQVG